MHGEPVSIGVHAGDPAHGRHEDEDGDNDDDDDDGVRYEEDDHRELRSCVKVEVTVLGSQSLISLMVSVDVKQH